MTKQKTFHDKITAFQTQHPELTFSEAKKVFEVADILADKFPTGSTASPLDVFQRASSVTNTSTGIIRAGDVFTEDGLVDPKTTGLTPSYVFDSFVIDSSNRFVCTVAMAVAEAPAKAYNPLFIYGGSGLGKTHLLHAIGNYAHNLNPAIRVRYVKYEEFTHDFHCRYHDSDILLVDDIHFLQGRKATQDAFFHTVNTLCDNGKQVVITSDVPPKQLKGFETWLRTRFEWGLIADVQPPDPETRIAILRKERIGKNLDS